MNSREGPRKQEGKPPIEEIVKPSDALRGLAAAADSAIEKAKEGLNSTLTKVPQKDVLATYISYSVVILALFGGGALILAKQAILGGVIFALALVLLITTLWLSSKNQPTPPSPTPVGPNVPAGPNDELAPELKKFCDHVKRATGDLQLFRFCCPDPADEQSPTWDEEFRHASVYHLWADPDEGSISCNWTKDGKRDCLAIRFLNKRGYASNVAIRPQGARCLIRHSDKREDYLCFNLKVASAQGELSEIAVAFRIYDRYFTQWIWGTSENAKMYYVIRQTDEWVKVAIPFTLPPWTVFPADSNHLYVDKGMTDRFAKEIPAVVLEVGSDVGPHGPGPGAGTLLVCDIELADHDPKILQPGSRHH